MVQQEKEKGKVLFKESSFFIPGLKLDDNRINIIISN